MAGATVSITGGFLTGDTLAANTAGTAITAIYDAATGVLTLSGSDTIAHYNQVLQNVTFGSSVADPTNGGTDTTRTISWKTDDGGAGNNLSNTGTTSLEAHVRPVVSAGGTVLFNAGVPVLLDPTVTAVDTDVNPIVSAKVAIVGGMAIGDRLAFNNGTNTLTVGGATITGSYDTSTGVLTLTGSAGSPTTADFQQALRSVTFVNSAAAGIARTISWTLSTSDPRQTSVASFSSIGPAPPPDTGPTIAPPPVGPPSGLFPPPSAPWFSGLFGDGSFSFTLPPLFFEAFQDNLAWLSNIFSSGPDGMPNFFDFGGFSFTIGPYGTINFTLGDARSLDFQTPYSTLAEAAGDRNTDVTAVPVFAMADVQGAATVKAVPVAAAVDTIPAPETADSASEREPAAPDRGLPPPAIEIDVSRVGAAEPLLAAGLAGAMDHPAVPDAVPAGKLGLSAQLRAAGRQGLLHDRQALLNSLHNGFGG
jgi:hypothetical protein